MQAIKLKILPPDLSHDLSKEETNKAWNGFRKLIREAMYQIARIRNAVISHEAIRIFGIKELDEKIQLNHYSIAKDIQQKILDENENDWSQVVSGALCSCASQHAKSMLSGENGIKLWKGNKSLPLFRRDSSIPLSFSSKDMQANDPAYQIPPVKTGKKKGEPGKGSTGAYWLVKNDDNHLCVRIRLFSKGGTFNFPIRFGNMDGSTRHLLKGIFSGEIVAGGGSINIDSRGEIYVNISYDPPNKGKVRFKSDRVLRVVMGIDRVAILTTNDSSYYYEIHDEVAENLRRYRYHYLQRRQETCKALRSPLQKRAGHGRANKLIPLNALSHNERNYQKTMNNNLSRLVIKIAKRLGAPKIIMENFEDVNVKDRYLRKWSYGELQRMTKEKGAKVGIKVEIIKMDLKDTDLLGRVTRPNGEKCPAALQAIGDK